MGKLSPWTIAVVLLVALGFILYDGGYVARWLGQPMAPAQTASVANSEQGKADLPPEISSQTPDAGAKAPPTQPKSQDDFLSRLGGLNIGLIAFSIAIVLGALIKLLSKFIPSVIRHE